MPPHPKGTSSPQEHRVGEHWSGTNKVPTIGKFIERLQEDQKERETHEQAMAIRAQKAEGKENKEAVPHRARKVGKGRTREVTDPTTGRQIEVEDLDSEAMEPVKNPMLVVPNANLGKETSVKTDSNQPLSEYKENQDITAPPDPIAEGATSDVPIHGERTNILFYPTPTISYKPMFENLKKRGTSLCIGIVCGIIVLGRTFGASYWGLIPLAFCIASGVWLWVEEVIRSGREMEWSSEQLRGQVATANLIPESVEWINTFVGIIWGLINPDMLAPVADTIEDIMQASSPGVIENVRIAEIDQGNNPIRLLSLRSLPDGHVQQLQENARRENEENKNPEEAAALEEGGSFYNFEASFAYHAQPTGQSASAKARNMHMQLVFYLGVRGLFGVPFPVFVELIEMVGTVRGRLQLIPEAPFVKDLTFSLAGIPHIRAGCMPMIKTGVNILNLPLISNFVNYAIGTACSLFAAPKSMTMDLSMIAKGDDIAKDTQALGIMWVRIHRATGLSKQDRRGSEGGGSDPYINLSFSKYGKPMYCTRVITDDLNPIWEETAALLVTAELIKADENLSVELWDSDRHTADDIVGKVELPIREMIQHPCRMYQHVSRLQGINEGSEMPGELHWEVGFFGKPKLRAELRTDGKKKDLPDNLKDYPAFEDEKGIITTDEEDAVTHTPPDPLWPSGILSIVVHQIVNLQLANIKGSNGDRKGREYEPAKPYGENTEEQGADLPTSYCKIILNDELIYRTRAKALSSKPIFNAGTERFVRDWRSAVVTVTVRDQRYREHDPILGVIPLKLSEIFETSSQVTRWYPLDGGIGFGRIRISLLFRHVETKLPPQMLGWNVGTFKFTSGSMEASGLNARTKIRIRTGGSRGKISSHACIINADNASFDLFQSNLHLPVKHRYRSPVVFELISKGKRGVTGYACLWLQHLADNEDTPVEIPIWYTKNGKRLTQNYITESNIDDKRSPGLEDLREIGRLRFRCIFTPGIDESHERFVVDNNSRETFETWEACIAEGVRARHIAAEVPEQTEQMHEKSLLQGRDILKVADPKERRRWIDKKGQDWSGSFGEDPLSQINQKPQDEGTNPKNRAAPGQEDGVMHLPDDNDDESSHSESSEPGHQAELHDKPHGHRRSSTLDTKSSVPSRPSTHTESSQGASFADTASSSTSISKRAAKRSEQRQQRGMMQWKPARNAVFAKNEAKFALWKVKQRFSGDLAGREPDIETETGG
ncbi:C2 domain protein [Aspergillus lucknowensis]|uniref:C2 domain protein n=1 Tax=Aspergillus lucknowensis TaxID=176173 RepID=A0ABR4LPX9_9EURO